MTSVATINLNILRATSMFASTEETRYYLNGVLVEIEPRCTTYVATDGHRAFVYRDALPEDIDHSLTGNFIIPTAECVALKVNRTVKPIAALSSDDGKSLRIEFDGTTRKFMPVDGSFPAWRRVLPRSELDPAGKISTFNWSLIATFQKAANMLDLGSTSLIHNGAGPAIVSFSAAKGIAFGLVMPPTKGPDMPAEPIPSWAYPEA